MILNLTATDLPGCDNSLSGLIARSDIKGLTTLAVLEACDIDSVGEAISTEGEVVEYLSSKGWEVYTSYELLEPVNYARYRLISKFIAVTCDNLMEHGK